MEEKLYQIYELVSNYLSGDDTFSESELLDKSHELAKELETPLREVMMGDDIEDISGFLAERFCK